MIRTTGRLGARMVVALGLLSAAGGQQPLDAQKVTESRWSLAGARGGFCIWYLIDPAIAPELADKGTVFAAAGTGSTLPKALAQTIQDEPRFISWIPAAICIGFYGSITIDDEQPILAAADQPLTLVTSLVAAKSPLGKADADFLLLKVASDSRAVRSQGGDPGLSIGGISVSSGKDRGSSEDRVDLRLEGTQITWVGHPSGEPSVGTTRSMSFGYRGSRSLSWQGAIETSPTETHLMIGTLRIEGKNLLAKALKSSPIRAVGPIETGGTGQLLFQLMSGRAAGSN